MAKKKPTLELLETATEEAANTMNNGMPPANLSMGNALFNLAISGDINVGMGPGRYLHLTGSSSSGKSWLTVGMLAEAARNPLYDNHRLVFFDQELGSAWDTGKYFGKKAATRIQKVRVQSLEQFYDKMSSLMREGPLLSVLDSFDAMTDETTLQKIEDDAKAREDNKDTKGSYSVEHAKIHSRRLRVLVDELGKTGSGLAAISQERSNITAGLYEQKTSISGGRALKFWASIQVSASLAGKIEKEVGGKKRTLGHRVRLKIEKNRISGKSREVVLSFIPGYGFDEIGSMIDWLTEEKFLRVAGGRIESPFYEKSYFREELIKKLEDDNKEPELRALLQTSWDVIEEQLTIIRKPRYE